MTGWIQQEAFTRMVLPTQEGLDDRTITQLIEIGAESAELPREVNGFIRITPAVRTEIGKFDTALERALNEWFQKRPLSDFKGDVRDMVRALMDADATYLVLMTLRGEGVGIWDGSWDRFFTNRQDLSDIQRFLEQKLRNFADDTGSGSLNLAFDDAAFEAAKDAGVNEQTQRKHEEKFVVVSSVGGGTNPVRGANGRVIRFDSEEEAQAFLLDQGLQKARVQREEQRRPKQEGGQDVAKIVLQQIKAMNRLALPSWGARDFVSFDGFREIAPGNRIGGLGGVQFKVRGTKPGMNRGAKIIIGLNGRDLYDVVAGRVAGAEFKVLDQASDVFFDSLVDVIDRMVG